MLQSNQGTKSPDTWIEMEIEAKYRLVNPTATNVQTFRNVIEECGFQADCLDKPVRIVDTYFDTTQHALQANGAAIRLRRKGEKTLLTYKRKVAREGALHARVELEAEPEPDHLEDVLSELRELDFQILEGEVFDLWGDQVEEILAAWGLIQMVEIVTMRQSCEVREAHQPVASFVLDHVNFEREARRGGYVGIEIEAIGEANTANVMKLSEALKDRLGESIQEQDISKYEYALGSLQRRE